MRYAADHKPLARQKLLDAAASHAKTHGFAGSGVDALAQAAGLTSGALYKHVGSKAELLREVMRSELLRLQQRYDALDPDDSAAVARMQAGYLSLHHARNPAQGCPLPPLAAEVARADDATRQSFQDGVAAVHASFQRLTGSADSAWALMAQNVGAVLIAAALPDDRLALWSAASGVSLRDGSWPVTASVPLVAPPRARVRPVTTALDRTLRWALAAALVCAGLSAWRYASQPTPAPLPAAASTAPAPGALLDRISISAPDLLPHLQSATYAGGAWVLVLAEAYDAAAMQRATRMLEGNGLVVQSARAPGPRLRVSLPVESKPQ